MDVNYDLILVLRSQFFEYLRETLYKHALERLEAARPEKINGSFFSSYGKGLTVVDLLEACDWLGHIFAPSASPRPFNKILAASPSSAVHGGQYDATYVTLE